MSPEETFGQQMQRIRKARGMSQDDLCRVLAGTGVPPHQTTISKLEGGHRPLRLNEACAIAAALGADLNSMVGEVGPDPDAAVLAYVARIAQLERAVATARRALEAAGGAA